MKDKEKTTNYSAKTKIKRIVAGIYRGINVVVFWPIRAIGIFLGKRDMVCNMLIPYSEAVEKSSNCYVNYSLNPKNASDINEYVRYSAKETKNICIVSQGPVVTEDNFTLETVRFYGKVYPDVLVIVSTWNDQDKTTIELLRKEKNCFVIENEYPECAGISHVNYQNVSSYNGINKAAELGMKYVLKTRNDMRITSGGVLGQLVDYINCYKPECNRQNSRIVLFNAYLFMPYRARDFFFFGNVTEMLKMFDMEMNHGKPVDMRKNIANLSYREQFNNPGGELIMIKNYFSAINDSVNCDLAEWWNVLGKQAIVLPISILTPIWHKYDFAHEINHIDSTFRRAIYGDNKELDTIVTYDMWKDMREEKFEIECYLRQQQIRFNLE